MPKSMTTKGELQKFKVPELRQKLVALGLSDKGNKPDLVDRLEKYYASEKGVDHVTGDESNDEANESIPEVRIEAEVSLNESVSLAPETDDAVVLSNPEEPKPIENTESQAAKNDVPTEQNEDSQMDEVKAPTEKSASDEPMETEKETVESKGESNQMPTEVPTKTAENEKVAEESKTDSAATTTAQAGEIDETKGSKRVSATSTEAPGSAKKSRRWGGGSSNQESPLSSGKLKDLIGKSVIKQSLTVITRTAPKPVEQAPPPVIEDAPIDEASVTTIVHITDFMRPVNLPNLKARMESYGDVKFFWMDSIKSQLIVTYDSTESAKAAYKAFHGKKWPEDQLQCRILKSAFIEQSGLETIVASKEIAKELKSREEQIELKQKRLEEATQRQFEPKRVAEASPAKVPNSVLAKEALKEVAKEALKEVSKEAVKRDERKAAPEPRKEVPRDNREKYTNSSAVVKLGDYFRKTTTKPILYFLPNSDALVKEKYGEKAVLNTVQEQKKETTETAAS